MTRLEIYSKPCNAPKAPPGFRFVTTIEAELPEGADPLSFARSYWHHHNRNSTWAYEGAKVC